MWEENETKGKCDGFVGTTEEWKPNTTCTYKVDIQSDRKIFQIFLRVISALRYIELQIIKILKKERSF